MEKKPIKALQEYLSGCSREQKVQTARLAGTTVNNLHQIAGGHTGISPTTAIMLEAATIIMAREKTLASGSWVHRDQMTDWFRENKKLMAGIEKQMGTKLQMNVA